MLLAFAEILDEEDEGVQAASPTVDGDAEDNPWPPWSQMAPVFTGPSPPRGRSLARSTW